MIDPPAAGPSATEPSVVAQLVARVSAGPPRCGATRLVCIDGPSGSGKTTLAARLAPALGGVPVVAMDDLYPGWDGLAAAVPLLARSIVTPLVEGRAARSPCFDWVRGCYGPDRELGTPPVLVVEGVGCGAREIAEHATLVVWVEAPEAERRRRGLTRDGGAYEPFWNRWAAQERAHFTAEATRARAAVIVAT